MTKNIKAIHLNVNPYEWGLLLSCIDNNLKSLKGFRKNTSFRKLKTFKNSNKNAQEPCTTLYLGDLFKFIENQGLLSVSVQRTLK